MDCVGLLDFGNLPGLIHYLGTLKACFCVFVRLMRVLDDGTAEMPNCYSSYPSSTGVGLEPRSHVLTE